MMSMKRMPRVAVLVVVGSLLAAGCGDDEPLPFEAIEDVTFHESLEIDLDEMEVTESGVYWMDLVVGDGEEAVSGSDATVSFLLRLRSGTAVQSSDDPGIGLITFTVDDLDEAIAGFHDGVRGMRVGGERRFIVPPELAYRERGPQGILIFDVGLDSVTGPLVTVPAG